MQVLHSIQDELTQTFHDVPEQIQRVADVLKIEYYGSI